MPYMGNMHESVKLYLSFKTNIYMQGILVTQSCARFDKSYVGVNNSYLGVAI